MEVLFLKILNMSISAVWIVLAVVLMRLLLKKAPKAVCVALWAIVALRLVVPFSFVYQLSFVGHTSLSIYAEGNPEKLKALILKV